MLSSAGLVKSVGVLVFLVRTIELNASGCDNWSILDVAESVSILKAQDLFQDHYS